MIIQLFVQIIIFDKKQYLTLIKINENYYLTLSTKKIMFLTFSLLLANVKMLKWKEYCINCSQFDLYFSRKNA